MSSDDGQVALDRPRRVPQSSTARRECADGDALPTSRPTLLLVAGLSVTVLTFGLPLAHLGARLPGSSIGLALLPLLVLGACSLRPTITLLTHLAFPVSHLPLLLAQPELVSREVYGGASGLFGLVAVATAFAMFLGAATTTLRPPKNRIPLYAHPELWRGFAIAVAVGPILALALPALTSVDADPLGASVAIGSGLAISVLAAGFWMPRLVLGRDSGHARGHFEGTAGNASSSDPRLVALARQSRPSAARTAFVLAIAAVALGGVAAWTYWRP